LPLKYFPLKTLHSPFSSNLVPLVRLFDDGGLWLYVQVWGDRTCTSTIVPCKPHPLINQMYCQKLL